MADAITVTIIPQGVTPKNKLLIAAAVGVGIIAIIGVAAASTKKKK